LVEAFEACYLLFKSSIDAYFCMEITKIYLFGKQLQHARKPKYLTTTISIEDINHWPIPSLWMTATFQEIHILCSITRKQHTTMKRTVQEMML